MSNNGDFRKWLGAVGDQIALDAGEVEETFIDGIDFLPGTVLSERRHEAVAHVGIQFIVGGKLHHSDLRARASTSNHGSAIFMPNTLASRLFRIELLICNPLLHDVNLGQASFGQDQTFSI